MQMNVFIGNVKRKYFLFNSKYKVDINIFLFKKFMSYLKGSINKWVVRTVFWV